MRVQPITNYNYNNYNYSSKTTSNRKTEPSFKAVENFLIYLVAKEGLSALAITKKYKYILALNEHINYYCDEKTFPAVLQALSKTNNEFYDGRSLKMSLLAFLDAKNIDSVEYLRWGALQELTRRNIKDDSYINIQTKKDFLMSLIDNNHPISPRLVRYFEKLDDRLYGTFKAEFIDKALFSEKYNSVRRDPNTWENYGIAIPESIKYKDAYEWTPRGLFKKICTPSSTKQGLRTASYQNLKLIETLDKNLYSAFIKNRRGAIEQSKKNVEDGIAEAKNNFLEWRNPNSAEVAFEKDYIRNLKSL